MKINKMKKEELELLSYTDIAYKILSENKISLNTAAIFKNICDLLEMSDSEYEDKIGDFYTSLNLDKRYVLLENHNWDLRERHAIDVEIDEEEVEDDIEEFEEEDNVEEEIENDITINEDQLETDDGIDDLSIIDDDDEDEI